MILDFEMAQRALQALENEQDLAAAREVDAAIAKGEQTVPLEELARELGLRLG